MKLYKFRSLQQFAYIADILCNNRFYASLYYDLNDPMEGLFEHDLDVKSEYLEQIRMGKENLRILSLSKDCRNLLLWAHYADGFKGICIELEVSPDPSFEVVDVVYSPFKAIFSNKDAHSIHKWPRIILRGKNEVWEYEEEVRLLAQSKFINTGIKITKVLLGTRTPDVMIEALRRLGKSKFPIYKTEISGMTNSVEIGDKVSSPKNEKGA